jgi:hypothetical protein
MPLVFPVRYELGRAPDESYRLTMVEHTGDAKPNPTEKVAAAVQHAVSHAQEHGGGGASGGSDGDKDEAKRRKSFDIGAASVGGLLPLGGLGGLGQGHAQKVSALEALMESSQGQVMLLLPPLAHKSFWGRRVHTHIPPSLSGRALVVYALRAAFMYPRGEATLDLEIDLA